MTGPSSQPARAVPRSQGHVAIITSNFWPEKTGTSQTVTEFARFLADRGFDVRVATSMPYYPEWRVWADYRRRLWQTEREAGLRIDRSWHFVRPRPSTLTRILHEATLSLGALPNIVRVLLGARIAYVVSPALSYAFTGMLLATLLRRPRVLVVKDVMPDAAVELGMMRNPVMIALSRRLARGVYAMAHEIHTLGDGMRHRIARETRDPSKIRIVVDTVDPEELAPVSAGENAFRAEYVRDGVFAVLHTGNMGKKQDLDLILRAADRLRDDSRFHFYVFGDGAQKERFLERRAALRLPNVSHHPLQERWMLRHMLSGADAVLVSQLAEVVDIVVPSKLITSLAAGAMIVAAAAAHSETARLVERSEGGLRIDAGDDVALVHVLQKLACGEIDPGAYRRRAREFALQTFGRPEVYGAIVEELGNSAIG